MQEYINKFKILDKITAELPKCNSQLSRSAAYKLLSAVCYNNVNYLNRLLTILNNFHQ